MNLIAHWKQVILEEDVSTQGRFQRNTVFLIRLFFSIALKFRDKQLHLQSTSLAYTTLLSLVPLLAVTFSVLKGLGVQDQLEPMLMQSLEPLGDTGAEIGANILNYVDNLNFAVLGFMGIALLFWTVVSLLQRVEEAFNAVWRVPCVRSLGRRFSDYLSVTLVGPVFMISAVGLTTMVLNNEMVQRFAGFEPFGWILVQSSRLIPFFLFCGAFAFLYSFLTNTRVRLIPALAGGIFAGVTWYAVGNLFATFLASSSRYSAIYSGLAAAVLFIIWVNVGWLIVLVGAHITRYWQSPHLLRNINAEEEVDDGHRETLALEIMTLIGRAHYFDEPKWTLEALEARDRGAPAGRLEGLIESLGDQGLLAATHEEPETYLPARAIERISLNEIVDAARGPVGANARLPTVEAVADRINMAISECLRGQTLRDLVLAEDKHPA